MSSSAPRTKRTSSIWAAAETAKPQAASDDPSKGIAEASASNTNRRIRRQIAGSSHQHTTAADVHRHALALYLLSSMDSVTGTQLHGEASLPPAFRSSEGTHICCCDAARAGSAPRRILQDALMNARGRLALNGIGLVDVDADHAGRRDRVATLQEKRQMHSGLDKAHLYHAFLVG